MPLIQSGLPSVIIRVQLYFIHYLSKEMEIEMDPTSKNVNLHWAQLYLAVSFAFHITLYG